MALSANGQGHLETNVTLTDPIHELHDRHMAVGQNQWYHFAPLILVYFSGNLDVHWGYGFLTHGHMTGAGP